jgi:hypothetical protein
MYIAGDNPRAPVGEDVFGLPGLGIKLRENLKIHVSRRTHYVALSPVHHLIQTRTENAGHL